MNPSTTLKLALRHVAAEPGFRRRSQAVSAMTNRWFGWLTLLVVTGVPTAYLCRYADPLIPHGEWHGLFLGLFVVVVRVSLIRLLRSLKRDGIKFDSLNF